MAYDESKDKKLWEKIVNKTAEGHIIVGVYQYGDIEKKVGIVRKVKTAEGESFRAIGRMTLKELEEVIPSLEQAKKILIKK